MGKWRIICIVLFLGLSIIEVFLYANTFFRETKDVNLDYEIIDLDENIFKYIPKERIAYHRHVGRVNVFDSTNSVGFQNEDGSYTAYIFSSPIRYRVGMSGYEDIDNRLINILGGEYSQKGYKYRNNKNDIYTYYPQELASNRGFLIENYFYGFEVGIMNVDFQNMGKKNVKNMYEKSNDSVVYRGEYMEVKSYSTKAGLRAEMKLTKYPYGEQVSFWIDSPVLNVRVSEAGYVLLEDEEGIQGIIRVPLIKGSSGKLYFESSFEVTKKEEKYILTLFIDENVLKENEKELIVDMSFEMHRSKFPDSVIYSNYYNKNQYLTDYGVIGNSEEFGIGRNYARLRVHRYITDKANNIKEANLAVYNLFESKEPSVIELLKVNSGWSSSRITWQKKVSSDYEIAEQKIEKVGYYYYDITDVVKECLEDDTYRVEDCGVLFKESDESNKYTILASSDHSIFVPFIEITFYELPENFDMLKQTGIE